MNGIEVLERRVAAAPDDARSHYQLAVLLGDTRGYFGVPEGDRELLARIRDLLVRVVTLDPRHAKAHAQLGYTLDQLGDLESGLDAFRMARALDPKRECVDVFVARMLVQLEREKPALAEIEALAKRRKVDLKKLRAELAKAKFPADAQTLLSNGFIHARNFFMSELSREAERIRNSLEPGRKQRIEKAERDDCAGRQATLRKEFKVANVPVALRPLASAAARYGIGDDPCRAAIMKRVPKATRARLIKSADRLAGIAQTWLDSFGGEKMSVEAAAYMYLYEAVEEIR